MRAIRLRRTSWSLEQAAAEVGWSLATFSRVENGKRHITSEDVATLMSFYRVPRKLREQMIENAKIGCQTGWWSREIPGILPDLGTLASYEADAREITDWSVNLVPGMLQTREYAVAYMRSDGIEPDAIEARWEARLRRQSRLPKIDYTAFLHENVFRVAFGGAKAYKAQLEHLHGAYDRGLGVRIVRELDAAMEASWMLIEFPQATPIVHVELMRSGLFLYDEEVAPYETARARIAGKAMTSLESRNVIGGILERL